MLLAAVASSLLFSSLVKQKEANISFSFWRKYQVFQVAISICLSNSEQQSPGAIWTPVGLANT